MNDDARQYSAAPSGEVNQKRGGGLDTVLPFSVKPAWKRPTLRKIDIVGTESSPLNWPVNNESVGYQIQS